MMKVLGKGGERTGRGYNNIFSFTPLFNQYLAISIARLDLSFNGVFSRDNLPRIKDGAYVMNLDDRQSTGTY